MERQDISCEFEDRIVSSAVRDPEETAPLGFGETSGDMAMYHDLVLAIVAALEARDPHTAEHSMRVADMTERVVRLMGLPAVEAEFVHMAAHVHDIGKIAMPDTILHRTRRLSESQHEVLRDHARIGAQIIGKSPSLQGIAIIVRHHHEHWDGSGYPDGLAGEEIPLGARIVSVCDAVDAMLGKREGKTPISEDECKSELQAATGHAFDPHIATLVLSHWDEIVGPIGYPCRTETASQVVATA